MHLISISITNITSVVCMVKVKSYTKTYVMCRRGRDRMVVGLTTTYAISAYHQWCCEFESRSGRGGQHYMIKFVSDLQQVGGFLWVRVDNLISRLPQTFLLEWYILFLIHLKTITCFKRSIHCKTLTFYEKNAVIVNIYLGWNLILFYSKYNMYT